MFALLIRQYRYGSDEFTEKLYHKIYASHEDAISGANKIMLARAKSLNWRTFGGKFVCVQGNTTTDFAASVVFKHSATSTEYTVASARTVEFMENE